MANLCNFCGGCGGGCSCNTATFASARKKPPYQPRCAPVDAENGCFGSYKSLCTCNPHCYGCQRGVPYSRSCPDSEDTFPFYGGPCPPASVEKPGVCVCSTPCPHSHEEEEEEEDVQEADCACEKHTHHCDQE